MPLHDLFNLAPFKMVYETAHLPSQVQVGRGKGSYAKRETYDYVGMGAGEYEKETEYLKAPSGYKSVCFHEEA